MSGSSTVLWTAAAILASSWAVYELLLKAPPQSNGIENTDERSAPFEAHSVQPALDGQARDAGEPAGEPAGHEERRHVILEEEPDEEAARVQDVGAEFDNDDRARRALEEHQARQAQDDQRVNAWKRKGVVGTKKARSLQKRDQRRAYFEYVRQEAERERERIQLEEDMFGDLVAEQREERQKRIEEARLALEESSRKRREAEEEERANRNKRRDEIKEAIQKKGFAKLTGDSDIEIADDLSKVLVLEGGDYAVTLTPKVIEALASELQSKGKLDFNSVQRMLPSLYN